jgi:predicted lipoprotein with Yx(FWY)xxD motif
VTKTLTLGAAAAVLALLTGCGSSSSSSSSSPASTTPETTTAAPSSSATTSGSSASTEGEGTVVSTTKGDLGTYLVAGPKHATVYLFEADEGGKSACSGACAHAWPPVITSGKPQASGHSVSADLGTIERSDGTMQVTYKGHPLYYFVEDTSHGEAKGEGSDAFGAEWYAMNAKGSKIDNDDGGDDDGS